MGSAGGSGEPQGLSSVTKRRAGRWPRHAIRARSRASDTSKRGAQASPSKSRPISVTTRALRERLGLGVDLRAADDPDLGQLRVSQRDQGLAQAAGALRRLRPASPRWRVTTMLRRPGSGRKRGGSESQVLRPMITGAPAVVLLEVRHVLRQVPGHHAVAADHAVGGAGEDQVDARMHGSDRDRRLDGRMVLVVDALRSPRTRSRRSTPACA